MLTWLVSWLCSAVRTRLLDRIGIATTLVSVSLDIWTFEDQPAMGTTKSKLATLLESGRILTFGWSKCGGSSIGTTYINDRSASAWRRNDFTK